MTLTFRGKLLAIVGTAGLALIVLIVASALIGRRADEQVSAIRDHYLPMVELEPRLEAQFDQLGRAMQDAVAARDADALAKTHDLEDAFVSRLDNAKALIAPADGAALRGAFEDYYTRAYDVSRRLLGGEQGEAVVDAIALMQKAQARTLELLRKAAGFDRGALAAAFGAAERAQVTANNVRLVVSVACLVLVILLSSWIGRAMIRSLAELSEGFERFGRGDFEQPITPRADDELGELALRANEMAANLRRLAAEREHTDWLKSCAASLAEELRGELAPAEVARRALRVVARHVEAPVGALYGLDADRVLRPMAGYAMSSENEPAAPVFSIGNGLVGQAAASKDFLIITDPPADYLRVRSGLGESAPRAIALFPLAHLNQTVGVLELATFHPWTERATELCLSVREMVAIALEVAQARARVGALLSETQDQARRLRAQEEELRSTNEELKTQQEALHQTNDELSAQAGELARQKSALQERNAELDVARRGLERKAEELSSVSAYKSQFLTNMSHELRTPLNSMLLLSNLLAENPSGNLTTKQVEFGHTIHSAGKDLLALINQVLDLAKVESGKQEIHIEEVLLRPLLAQMQRVFEPLAKDKGLALTFDVDPVVSDPLATDRQRFEQILRNLLGNAIKFTDRGTVSLRVRRSTSFVEFAVSDTGIGIAAQHQERVFAPFEQVDAATDRRHGGTGLGLAIARELAHLLGGELRLQSLVGEGSTFTLCLPAERRGASPTPRPGATGCVLVIEDDKRFSDALGEVIGAQKIEYLVARDGRNGLQMAKDCKPSGIILDVKLPDLDGWSVMAALRADPVTAAIPVHFVSAIDASERGLAMGAVGYLTKPASRDDLIRVVESLAPRAEVQRCAVLVTEDDAVLGESLMKQLKREQVDVERAATAREALDAIARRRFDCVILDLGLPDMDGLELLHAIVARHGADRPGVVVYTARALTKAETRRLEEYAEAIVLKDGSSQDRLIDEVRLFVGRLKEGGGPQRPPAPLPARRELKGKKILLADDDMRTVYALSAALAAKGAEVLCADTGRVAVDTLMEHPDVALVLMDIMMPEMDGYEAMRRIRADARFTTLPIVALTAKAMKGDAERCLQAGASDYMSKPVDAANLLALISDRLESSSKG